MSSDSAITNSPTPKVVDTDDGPVTVAPIDYLERLDQAQQSQLRQLSDKVQSSQSEIAQLETQAGQTLTDRVTDWASQERLPRIDAARGLETLVSDLEQRISEIEGRERHGLSGLIQGLQAKRERSDVRAKIESAKGELDARYRAVAEGLMPSTGIADADSLLRQIVNEQSQVSNSMSEIESLSAASQRLSKEIDLRKRVRSEAGFDALGTQADLLANGLRPISVNLVLRPKEIAVASEPATLCRYRTRTQYVGGSHGLSIPLGHGFRYRISSFRGRPIQNEELSELDQGTLVVSNQRLVFLGSKRDVSTPIARILQVEPYSDAVAVSREGKEARDIYLVARPDYVLLFLQWVISHQD